MTFKGKFCPNKIDQSGNTIWPQTSGFQKLAKSDHFGIFNQLLSTQNVNVSRFARNVEWDFFYDFQSCFPPVLFIFEDRMSTFRSPFRKNIKWSEVPKCHTFSTVVSSTNISSVVFFPWELLEHSVWKSQKKSHSTLRAKRAMFTFWVDKSSSKMPKMSILASFQKCDFLGDFQTLSCEYVFLSTK